MIAFLTHSSLRARSLLLWGNAWKYCSHSNCHRRPLKSEPGKGKCYFCLKKSSVCQKKEKGGWGGEELTLKCEKMRSESWGYGFYGNVPQPYNQKAYNLASPTSLSLMIWFFNTAYTVYKQIEKEMEKDYIWKVSCRPASSSSLILFPK